VEISTRIIIQGRLSGWCICGEEGLQEPPWMDALFSGSLHQRGKDAVGFQSAF